MITDGIININKPQNMTSHDVVAILRRALGIKRIGHTGTLDPMATGVLPVCVGKATRIIEYLDTDKKTYRCSMELGKTTDTLDIWGEVLSENSTDAVTEEMITAAFDEMQGEIWQRPPMYSALKVNGRKLYEYAREGRQVEIKKRRIFIYSMNVDSIDLNRNEVCFTCTCSRGTYIRTICDDIGMALGCGGIMTGLKRTASGAFLVENAIDIETVRKMTQNEALCMLLPVDYPLGHLGEVLLSDRQSEKFTNGLTIPADRTISISQPKQGQWYKVYKSTAEEKVFLGVAKYNIEKQWFKADKVIITGDKDANI